MNGWHFDPPEPDVGYAGGWTHEDCPLEEQTIDITETRDVLTVTCSCGASVSYDRETGWSDA